jgi:hypothetical protein
MMFVVDQNMMAAISSTENEVYKSSAESEASLTDFSGYMGKRKSRLHFENTIFNQITQFYFGVLNFNSYIQYHFLHCTLPSILCSFTLLTSEA